MTERMMRLDAWRAYSHHGETDSDRGNSEQAVAQTGTEHRDPDRSQTALVGASGYDVRMSTDERGWESWRTESWAKDGKVISAQVRESDDTVHVKVGLLRNMLAELGWVAHEAD